MATDLPALGIDRLVSAAQSRTVLAGLPTGDYRVIGRTLTARGDASRGIRAQVQLAPTKEREEQLA